MGPRALLAEVADVGEALALATWARGARLGADEIVPAARTVLLDGIDDLDRGASGAVAVAALRRGAGGRAGRDRRALRRRRTSSGSPRAGAPTSTAWSPATPPPTSSSAFCGFAPGFAYLSGLPDELAVPRLDSPRSQVPAGSVGLAGAWCGVYPTASPGGWRLIGHTDERLWDPTSAQPALLAPGTRVRFVAA